MAQVVELFGAPGTGKSSLVGALDESRSDGRRIVAAQRLTRVARGGPLGGLARRALTPAERRRSLAAAADRWGELLAFIADGPLGRAADDAPHDPLRPLYAPGWLATALELRALADAAPADVIVLLDEGLAQRASIACGPDLAADRLERYVALLPATALHVHVDVTDGPDVERLLDRLAQRDRVIDRHVGLDRDGLRTTAAADLERARRTAAALRGAGATVTRVDAGGAPQDASAALLEQLGTTLG